MGGRQIEAVNWRDELRQLEPFVVGGMGGVVLVEGSERVCAASAFVKSVRDTLERTRSGCLTLQIEPDDPSTHYPDSILRLFEDKLFPNGESGAIDGPSLQIASNINARDVILGNITINEPLASLGSLDPYVVADLPRRKHLLACRVKEVFDRGQRIVPVLYALHRMERICLEWFWQHMWGAVLEPLVSSGLLLIAYLDPSLEAGQLSSFAPANQLVLSLPSVYGPTASQHALADLTRIFGTDSSSAEQAADRARVFLATCQGRPHEVHDRLAGTLWRLRGSGSQP